MTKPPTTPASLSPAEAGGAHTPGPWAINCSHIYAPDGAIIATVHNPGSKASDYPLVANRDLMAAAPELLSKVKIAEAIFEEYARLHLAKGSADGNAKAQRNMEYALEMHAAIARATGAA